MCGIIAIFKKKQGNITGALIESLKRLEYRGYDSAGIAFVDDSNQFHLIKAVGKIGSLVAKVNDQEYHSGRIGIGHTRWATHGGVTIENAHPHTVNGISIIHNGIVENYIELKKHVSDKEFTSQTDSEVICQLISHYVEDEGLPFVSAFRKTISLIKGLNAIVAISEKDKTIAGYKRGSPLAVGQDSDNNVYISSDALALCSLSPTIKYMKDGDIVVVKDDGYQIYDADFQEVSRDDVENTVSFEDVSKGEHADYILKEIHEEPDVLIKTYNNFKAPPIDMRNYSSLCFIACGTSYYAGLLAKYWIEDIAKIAVSVDIASEFRYRNPVLSKNCLYIFISQSGETVDTLSAMRKVSESGCTTLSIVNVNNSSIARESDYNIMTHAGIEIGVASTKAFISQALTSILLFVDKNKIDVNSIANAMRNVLSQKDKFDGIAQNLKDSRIILFVGRGTNYPISLEGSLKLKEITYISSEGIPSGEIKHGPIALIDNDVHTVILAPNDKHYEKTISNAQEILARNGKILLIGHRSQLDVNSIETIDVGDIGNPFVMATSVHLLAYCTAKAKNGIDVDKPRNLAKSVTVE